MKQIKSEIPVPYAVRLNLLNLELLMFIKILTLSILVMLTSVAYTQEQTPFGGDRDIKTYSLDNERNDDKFKAGVSLGYPLGITAGYRFSNFFEINGLIGSDYNSLTAGGSGLFTVANIDISGNDFPLSIGPAFYAHFGDDFKFDVLATVRFEYSFKEVPINLFIEAGAGLKVYEDFGPAGSLAIGIRYIF